MASALNSILGGGNILNTALNVASMCFPPLGIATSLANMVQQGIGQAVTQAAGTLTQVAGMPKFLAQEVGDIVGKVLGQLTHATDPGCDQHVQDRCGDAGRDFRQSFADSLVKYACEEMGPGKSGGKGHGGSWFEALVKALGKALDDQAANVQKLSDAVQGQDAKDNPSGFTDLQAASQRMSFMMSAADQVIKTLGEALNTAARKQ